MIKTKLESWDIWGQDVSKKLTNIQGGEVEEVNMHVFGTS